MLIFPLHPKHCAETLFVYYASLGLMDCKKHSDNHTWI